MKKEQIEVTPEKNIEASAFIVVGAPHVPKHQLDKFGELMDKEGVDGNAAYLTAFGRMPEIDINAFRARLKKVMAEHQGLTDSQ